MPPDSTWTTPALGVLAVLAVALVLLGAVVPLLPGRKKHRAVHAKVSAEVSKGTDTSLSKIERARAFVRAGEEALQGLKKPSLAARYAKYAHDLAPADEAVTAFMIEAMRASKRWVHLERGLWQTLDAAREAKSEAAFAQAHAALIALYEGELKRPERARVLRLITLQKVA
jgi:hypothetical protein